MYQLSLIWDYNTSKLVSYKVSSLLNTSETYRFYRIIFGNLMLVNLRFLSFDNFKDYEKKNIPNVSIYVFFGHLCLIYNVSKFLFI